MTRWQRFETVPGSPQRYAIEGSVLFWEVHGDVRVEEFAEHMDRVDQVARAHGHVSVILGMREANTLPPEVRRYAAARRRKELGGLPRTVVVASYGASVAQRAALELLHSVLRQVMHGDVPFAYFATEAEALAYCGEQQRLAAARAAK